MVEAWSKFSCIFLCFLEEMHVKNNLFRLLKWKWKYLTSSGWKSILACFRKGKWSKVHACWCIVCFKSSMLSFCKYFGNHFQRFIRRFKIKGIRTLVNIKLTSKIHLKAIKSLLYISTTCVHRSNIHRLSYRRRLHKWFAQIHWKPKLIYTLASYVSFEHSSRVEFFKIQCKTIESCSSHELHWFGWQLDLSLFEWHADLLQSMAAIRESEEFRSMHASCRDVKQAFSRFQMDFRGKFYIN